jgi:indole-3-glycerol phosphate synthase
MADRFSAADDFLVVMAASSRLRLEAARRILAESELRARAEAVVSPQPLKLSTEGFDLIAEVKKRSPSAGKLTADPLSPASQADFYRQGGAAAFSVLTEPDRFDGAIEDLEAVVAAVQSIPAMRKDFLVSPYQVLEARAAGAGGVLLIAAILNQHELRDMLQLSLQLGMFVLVEAFDADDLDHCVPIMQDCGPAIVGEQARMLLGINSRDLRSLRVDFDRFAQLAASLPPDTPSVAESGVMSPPDARHVAQLGYRLALVGTALMKSDDPVSLAKEILVAGRQAV